MGIETVIAIGLAAAGTAVSVYGQQQQAKAAENVANMQEQQGKEDAAFAASEAQVQARMIRKAGEKQRADARASLAGAGVTVGVGTAEQIDKEIQGDSEQDALMAIYDGSNRSRAITQSANQEAYRSRNAAQAARIGSVSSALQGGATIAKGWNTTNSKKVA
ncbi:hypothetical protein H4CHR_01576 [Variovorax sp. PBS-H4]|uniref:hypothetical protein n=1 Tax=Variovorax sp. PBS-H4 TaxID=434008 RepID=UPI001315E073|nr:hypothetical protein [Variovorax sp. PBS-H4]VTU25348.1 hypothetical protein H4CHR_01576 [Variovorax sp. PBS-H4]